MVAKKLEVMFKNADRNELREGLMYLMNEYILTQVNNENYIEPWLMCAVPDGSEAEEFAEFAEDEEMWHDCLRIFQRDVTRDEKEEGDEEEW